MNEWMNNLYLTTENLQSVESTALQKSRASSKKNITYQYIYKIMLYLQFVHSIIWLLNKN